MSCRVGLSQIMARMQRSSWRGPSAIGVGSNYNYSYVLADTVPDNQFWIVSYASLIPLGGANLRLGLWIIRPGILPASDLSPYQRNNFFFQGDLIPTIANGPPVGPYAWRVDSLGDWSTTDNVPINSEYNLITQRVIVPSKHTLMGHGGSYGFGIGGGIGEQFQLQAAYTPFGNDELVGQVPF